MDCLMQNEHAWALGQTDISRISRTETSLQFILRPHFFGQPRKGPPIIWKSADIMKLSLHRPARTPIELTPRQVNLSMPLEEVETL